MIFRRRLGTGREITACSNADGTNGKLAARGSPLAHCRPWPGFPSSIWGEGSCAQGRVFEVDRARAGGESRRGERRWGRGPGEQQRSASGAAPAAGKRQRCCRGGSVDSSGAPALLYPRGGRRVPRVQAILTLRRWLAGSRNPQACLAPSLAIRFSASLLALLTPARTGPPFSASPRVTIRASASRPGTSS